MFRDRRRAASRALLVLLLSSLSTVVCSQALRAISVSGTVRYLGANGPVSTSRPIQVHIGENRFKAGKLDAATVPIDRGPYTVAVPTAGDYFLVYFLDLIPDGKLNVSEPYQFYFNQFSAANADALAVPSTGLSDVKLGFDDHFIMSGVAGAATYTGSRGTVSAQTPLVVTANTDATMLGTPFGHARLQSNGDRYDILDPSLAQTIYLMAFLDLNDNGTRDPIEPFEIYQDRASTPGDPVMIAPNQTGIDFVFGDENLPPTPTPTPAFCVGDCNSDGLVTVDEVLTMVNIALGNTPVTACAAGDANHDNQITVDEILLAVDHALNGCSSR
ncbi:MAG: hypothetical protein ACHQ9S_07420 [Candidatus Binatia bacterium]